MNRPAYTRGISDLLVWIGALAPIIACGQLITEVEIKTGAAAGKFDITHKNFVPPPETSAGWVFIPLPVNMQPLQVSSGGTVLLADSNYFYRWRNGVIEPLHARHPLGSVWVNPLNGRNYSSNEPLTAVNAAGEIALNFNFNAVWSLPGSRNTYFDSVYWLKKWAPGATAFTEFAGPPFSFTTLPFNLLSVNYLSQNLASLRGLNDNGALWVQVGDQVVDVSEYFGQFDQRLLTKIVRVAASGAVTETPFKQPDLRTTFQFSGVSASGTAIGSVRTTGVGGTTKYYVGNDQVDFRPTFINRHNWLLGTPAAGGATFVQQPGGARPPLPADGNVTWIDDQNRLNGVYARPDTGEQVKAVWIAQEGTPLTYERRDYYTLRPTAPWTTNHEVAPATTALQLGLMTRPTDTGTETRPFLAVPCALAVDANRDGEIHLPTEIVPPDKQDVTSATKPYRFWLNDDDDGDQLRGEGEFINNVRDHEFNRLFGIRSHRDLEDFSRLHIYLGGLQDAIAAGTIKVGLKWKEGYSGSPAMNLYLSADATGSDSYVTDATGAAVTAQITGDFKNVIKDASDRVTVNTSGVFIFKPEFWSGLNASSAKKCLLFEGDGIGSGQLVVVLLDQNGNSIGEGPGV